MEEDGKEIPSKWEVFGISGPIHLTSIDWGIPDLKRTIAASLIQGVYISQRDHKLNRTDQHKAQAPNWWQFFNFQPIQFLHDPFDHSIFGAIYAYKPLPSNPKRDNLPATSSQSVTPPSHVIAFRGTKLDPETRQRDIYLDMNLPLKGLPYDPRYHRAVQAVLWLIGQVDYKSVWLTGHSLGAAIALQVGKDMAKKGTYIETFLFNPPYHSAPVERIQNPFVKTRIRVAKSLITAGLSVAFKGNNNKDDYTPTTKNDPFNLLCSWVPNVFVNPRDPISCEYIGYFEHRDRMEAMGMGKIGNIATKNSIMNYLSGVFGRDGEPPHLVPSALLIKNINFSEPNVMVAHGIHQWWQPHSWMSKLHIFSECNCQ